MDRRHLLSLMSAGLGMGVAGPALASGDEKPAAAVVNLQGVGLPVIAGGRIRNYVFVSLRLHLSASAVMETVRAKDAHFRDALVKAAHRTPFTVAGDWTRLDENRMSAALVAAANAISGRGSVARAEIIAQNPRLRAGMTPGV